MALQNTPFRFLCRRYGTLDAAWSHVGITEITLIAIFYAGDRRLPPMASEALAQPWTNTDARSPKNTLLQTPRPDSAKLMARGRAHKSAKWYWHRQGCLIGATRPSSNPTPTRAAQLGHHPVKSSGFITFACPYSDDGTSSASITVISAKLQQPKISRTNDLP